MEYATDSVTNNIGNTLSSLLWKGTTVGCGILAVCIGVLYVKQESLLYFPEIADLPRRLASNPRRYRSPSEYNVPYETNMITCADGIKIHSWLMIQPNSKMSDVPTLVFFHGNAGNIGYRLPNAHQMYTNLQANIFLVEYRGYGNSDDAKPSEAGLKLDSEAALNFILNNPKVDSKSVFIFGRSLGGAVAFHLADYAQKNRLPIAGVIVENTFVSISDMVDHIMPFVAPVKSLVLRIGWNSGDIVKNLKTPVLYLAGDDDQLVPHSQMIKLLEISGKSSKYAKMHVVNGGTHNETWLQGGREYWQAINNFMQKVLATQKQRGRYVSSDSIEILDGDDSKPYGKSNCAIGMGTDTDQAVGAIPIMPNNFMGIAKEVTTTSASNTQSKKKD